MKRLFNIRLVIAVLIMMCLTTVLLIVSPTRSNPTAADSSDSAYNPWADINDDGQIDIYDAIGLALAFGTSGTPAAKASLEFDSGWINLTGVTSQNYVLTHNLTLTSADMVVDARQETQGWNETYGGTDRDNAYSVVQAADGGYAMGGWTNSFGAGGADVYLVKIDADGATLWNRTYGGKMEDEANSLIQTADGGYALAGYTYSFGAGYWDCYLVRTDADGNMLWNKTYGGADGEVAYSVVQTADGGYALAGWTDSSGAGWDDLYLIKTDADGNMLWNKTYGGARDDWARALVQTSDGGYAITGWTDSFGAGLSNFYLVKTDSDGNMLWSKTYGGASDAKAFALVQTNDGGYALAGSIYYAGDVVYLVKTDADGVMQWSKIFAARELIAAYSMVQTADGGYALAGITDETFGAGGFDFYLARTDAEGNVLWIRTYGGTEDEWPYSLVETADGGYMIAGVTMSFGAGLNLDAYLVKTEGESGLAWMPSSVNSIALIRDAATPWSLVRVQIWKKR